VIGVTPKREVAEKIEASGELTSKSALQHGFSC
jgi:hypothetical protein